MRASLDSCTWLSWGIILLCVSCGDREHEPRGELGEPALVQLDAAGSTARYEMALAVSRGAKLDELVAPISGRLHRVVQVCPTLVSELGPEQVATLRFSLSNGVVTELLASAEVEACVASELGSRPWNVPGKLDVLAQLRPVVSEDE